jgi:hypothetical protein
MTDRDVRFDLEDDSPDEILALAERLQRERPAPRAAFRGDLRRRLVAGGSHFARPQRLRALIVGYAAGGSLLLLVGALSAAGAGPLAA